MARSGSRAAPSQSTSISGGDGGRQYQGGLQSLLLAEVCTSPACERASASTHLFSNAISHNTHLIFSPHPLHLLLLVACCLLLVAGCLLLLHQMLDEEQAALMRRCVVAAAPKTLSADQLAGLELVCSGRDGLIPAGRRCCGSCAGAARRRTDRGRGAVRRAGARPEGVDGQNHRRHWAFLLLRRALGERRGRRVRRGAARRLRPVRRRGRICADCAGGAGAAPVAVRDGVHRLCAAAWEAARQMLLQVRHLPQLHRRRCLGGGGGGGGGGRGWRRRRRQERRRRWARLARL